MLSFSKTRLLELFVFASVLLVMTPGYGQERPERGQIVYEGIYSGRAAEGFLFLAGSDIEGAITLTVDFDGPAVRAKYRTTGKLAGGSVSGLIAADNCRLEGRRNLRVDGECTATEFNGTLVYQPRSDRKTTVTFRLVNKNQASGGATASRGSIGNSETLSASSRHNETPTKPSGAIGPAPKATPNGVVAASAETSGSSQSARRGDERSSPSSMFSAADPSEIGVAGLGFGMTMQQAAARLVAANVNYKTGQPRNLNFRMTEPIQNLPIEVDVNFVEADSLAGITLGHQGRQAKILYETWLAGLVQRYGSPTSTTNRNGISSNVFCHTPGMSIRLGLNANTEVTPVPRVYLAYSGALGLVRNLCERAPQNRAFQVSVFPLPDTTSTNPTAASHASGVALSPTPVPAPDMAAADKVNLTIIEGALSLILEARPFGDRYIPGSAVSARTGVSDDRKAAVVAGSYRFYVEGSSREVSSEFFARFENSKIRCIRMSTGATELAPCEPVPASSEAARQARFQAERSNPKMLAPPGQSRSWAVVKCGLENTACIEREYQMVYESISSDVLINARSAFKEHMPKANYRDVLDAIVAIDSRRWSVNQYIRGSMRDISVNEVGEFTDVSGYYGFGSNLWVTVRFRGGRMMCMKYWDTDSCSSSFVDQYSSTPALSDMEIAENRRLEAINAPIRRYNECIDAANRMSEDGFRDRALLECRAIRPGL